MAKHPVETGIEDVVKTYELLDRVRLGRDFNLRDDQFEAEALRDASALAREKGLRMGLVDTGRFDASRLEEFIRNGVRLFTSDESPRPAGELGVLLKAGRKSRSSIAYFRNGPLPGAEAGAGLSLGELDGLVRDGMDVHLSNVTHRRDFAVLEDLAGTAHFARAFLVYYHHGPVDGDMAGLAARGAWLHVSDRSFRDGPAGDLVLKIVEAARRGGSRAAVYVQDGLPLAALRALFAAGAVILFQTPPSDRTSLQRPLELQAAKRRLPARAVYLTTAFLH
jgi:hypothetical protein